MPPGDVTAARNASRARRRSWASNVAEPSSVWTTSWLATSRGKPDEHAGFDHRLRHEEHVRRTGAGQARDRVERRLADRHDDPDRAEQSRREIEMVVAGVATGRDRRRAEPDERGRVRHRAHDRPAGHERFEGRDRDTGRDREHERLAAQRRLARSRRLAATSPGFTATITTSASATAHAGLGTTRTFGNSLLERAPALGVDLGDRRASSASHPPSSRPPSSAAPIFPPPISATLVIGERVTRHAPIDEAVKRGGTSSGPRNLRNRPALPRTELPLPHLGPGSLRVFDDKTTVARPVDALQDHLQTFSDDLRRSSGQAPECDADRDLEPSLDELVEHADDAVELVDVEVLEQHAADEIAVAVGTDREVRAVRRVVARSMNR